MRHLFRDLPQYDIPTINFKLEWCIPFFNKVHFVRLVCVIMYLIEHTIRIWLLHAHILSKWRTKFDAKPYRTIYYSVIPFPLHGTENFIVTFQRFIQWLCGWPVIWRLSDWGHIRKKYAEIRQRNKISGKSYTRVKQNFIIGAHHLNC